MKWRMGRRSDNVEDRRGMPGGAPAIGGIGVLVIVLIGSFLGVRPAALMQIIGGAQRGAPQQNAPRNPEDDQLGEFVKVVLADTEDVWNARFRAMGKNYEEPKLVLFSGRVQSGCGAADSAMGPFYCPADKKVYIDLSFYRDLKQDLKAPGDFAQAYVIAHEVGHHVQNLLGTSDYVHRQKRTVSKEEYNQLSVRLELQADYYAGVWANHAQKMRDILEPGDIEEALNAANAIGDDRLQQKSRGYVVPETFTHGTSAQRVKWFRKGFESGDVKGGDALFNMPYRNL